MNKFVDDFSLHLESTDADFTGHFSWSVLGNLLLLNAGKHAERRGWGMKALNEEHKTWVLSRLFIEMDKMPTWKDDIVMSTWVGEVIRLFNYRNFVIKKGDGEVCGYASSVWSIIDTETRKPLNLTELKDGSFVNLTAPEEEINFLCPAVEWTRFHFDAPQHVKSEAVQYSDMDVNNHVNSIRYIEHILNLFPCEHYQQQRVKSLEIAYKAEARMGDVLDFYLLEVETDVYDVEIRKNATHILCQARIFFEDLDEGKR